MPKHNSWTLNFAVAFAFVIGVSAFGTSKAFAQEEDKAEKSNEAIKAGEVPAAEALEIKQTREAADPSKGGKTRIDNAADAALKSLKVAQPISAQDLDGTAKAPDAAKVTTITVDPTKSVAKKKAAPVKVAAKTDRVVTAPADIMGDKDINFSLKDEHLFNFDSKNPKARSDLVLYLRQLSESTPDGQVRLTKLHEFATVLEGNVGLNGIRFRDAMNEVAKMTAKLPVEMVRTISHESIVKFGAELNVYAEGDGQAELHTLQITDRAIDTAAQHTSWDSSLEDSTVTQMELAGLPHDQALETGKFVREQCIF